MFQAQVTKMNPIHGEDLAKCGLGAIDRIETELMVGDRAEFLLTILSSGANAPSYGYH